MWNFFLFPIFLLKLVSSADVFDGTKKLLLVQAIWRHGDRSPTSTFKSDKFTEDYWRFGGGGWGQLTPRGMKEQLKLGKKIRDRYINGNPYKFLSENYDQQEIFVRSSDKNRTLLSAYANMVGMYSSTNRRQNFSQNFNRAGIDYPDDDDWPAGLVPIPIHTMEIERDRLLDVDGPCPLQEQVWEIAKTTKPVSDFFSDPNVTSFMKELTGYCGQEINPENLWILFNSLKIEKIYYNSILKNMTPWYTDEIFEKVDIYNAQVQDFQDGLGLDGILSNGIDVGKTLKKTRGGTLINDFYNRMTRKIECLGNSSAECSYVNNLKYMAYSAHDTTIYAILSILGLSHEAVKPRGYPLYAASAYIEQWQDTQTNKTYFKFIYSRNENDTLTNVLTSKIQGCSGDYCELAVFQNISQTYRPDIEMNSWCSHDITKYSSNNQFSFFIAIFSVALFYFM